jgi:hypothetical protein
VVSLRRVQRSQDGYVFSANSATSIKAWGNAPRFETAQARKNASGYVAIIFRTDELLGFFGPARRMRRQKTEKITRPAASQDIPIAVIQSDFPRCLFDIWPMRAVAHDVAKRNP